MKFKLFILTISAVLASVFSASAQNKDKGFFVEMNFGYGTEYYDTNSYLLTPAIGYRFANRWSTGFRVQFEPKFKTLGLFGQYRFINGRNWDVFTEGQLSYTLNRSDMIGGGRSDYKNYAEAGFTFGAAYRIWKGLRVTAHYLYLGYSGSPDMRRSGACWGDKSMILDAGWNRLQVGLQYTF